jgi:glycosyltransferase involved in cell wall biosynthesis
VREVLSDGVSGTLIPPGEIASIAEGVIDLLRDPERRTRMGESGRALVEERFDMYSWARRLADVYAEATAGSHTNQLGSRSGGR